MNELQKTDVEVRAQVDLIQRVMKSVMKKDVHYGIIPGCQKPTLYKAGAEVLASTFRLAVDPEIIDLSNDDEIRYRVRVKLLFMGSGNLVGIGLGECSTNEEKYKWRAVTCTEEWDATPEDRRREKWQSGSRGGAAIKRRQVRTNIADLANTVLKMAKKRAQIDAVLTATAASDIFMQDEDITENIDIPDVSIPEPKKPEVSMPKSTVPEPTEKEK